MAPTRSRSVAATIAEITQAEHRRALEVKRSPVFLEWAHAFRLKFIVNAFLTPVYAQGGWYSIARLRVQQFGDYILASEKYGQVFQAKPKAWIRSEDTWFWIYVTGGQDMIPSDRPVPNHYQITGIPAVEIWKELVKITKQLNLDGDSGGGISTSKKKPEGSDLAEEEKLIDAKEVTDSFWKESQFPMTPAWVDDFGWYHQQAANNSIALWPAWYYLAEHAFFNTPFNQLPIFGAAINARRQVDQIRFLDPELSNRAREHLGKVVLRLPEKVLQATTPFSVRKEQMDMTYWLLNKVKFGQERKTLSYGKIAAKTGVPASTIQASISRFDKRLEKMDGIFLGRLLRIASQLGLDPERAYQVLAKRKVVPRRRQADSFDDVAAQI